MRTTTFLLAFTAANVVKASTSGSTRQLPISHSHGISATQQPFGTAQLRCSEAQQLFAARLEGAPEVGAAPTAAQATAAAAAAAPAAAGSAAAAAAAAAAATAELAGSSPTSKSNAGVAGASGAEHMGSSAALGCSEGGSSRPDDPAGQLDSDSALEVVPFVSLQHQQQLECGRGSQGMAAGGEAPLAAEAVKAAVPAPAPISTEPAAAPPPSPFAAAAPAAPAFGEGAAEGCESSATSEQNAAASEAGNSPLESRASLWWVCVWLYMFVCVSQPLQRLG